MVVAARAAGLRPIDGPFGDFTDPEGFKAQARRAAVLGCEGKWAIHPSQIELANEVNSPSKAEVDKAQRILKAMRQAQKEGRSEERRVGKECVSTGRSRGSPYHSKKKKNNQK